MPDETLENQEQQPTEARTYTQDEFESEVSKIKSKLDEVLGEKKAEQAKRRALEEQQRELEKRTMAEKEDFKGLFETTKGERDSLAEKYEQLLNQTKADKVDGSALKIAASIGADEASQELLAEQAKKFIDFEDGKAVYKIGSVEVDKDTVIKTLSEKYPMLVKGSGATGGGASGSDSRGAAPLKKGDMGGDREARKAAIAKKFNL